MPTDQCIVLVDGLPPGKRGRLILPGKYDENMLRIVFRTLTLCMYKYTYTISSRYSNFRTHFFTKKR